MNTTRRLCLPLVIAAVLLTGCQDTHPVAPPSQASFDQITPGVAFDWSVPARLGHDTDGDGLVDYPRSAADISPEAWPVNFDACAIPGGSQRTTYIWYINGVPAASLNSCEWSHEFPAEGQYVVKLQVVPMPGKVKWTEQVVTVQDWLIVSFGDSYASGEGVPEVAAADGALLASFAASVASLQAAAQHLAQMQANLTAALEDKGLWESILATRQAQLNAFLAACTDIENWSDVVECANFLAGVPFDTFQNARNHFIQARDNAQERLNDALAALTSAQDAFAAAQSAVAGIEATIAALSSGVSEPRWQARFANEGDGECHRSANAAPARAALALEAADPRTSVTFVHLACSGAQTTEAPSNVTDQIRWARQLLGAREIDAVLMSAGGNDAGFASIAQACVVQLACYGSAILDPDAGLSSGMCQVLGLLSASLGTECASFFSEVFGESAADIVTTGLNALPGRYGKVADSLGTLDGLSSPSGGGTRSNRVYITEYVDMTRDDGGAYCAFSPLNLLGALPGIVVPEMAWLDVNAAGAINTAVAAGASANGWNAVGGIHSAYTTRGYCANTHWVVRLHESILTQGDHSGVAHPNNAGHAHNGAAIFAALLGDLYPQGLGAGPRAPDA